MAALVDGQSYGLSSHGQNSENRTLVFVKLTDSALRAIEEYLICRGTTNRQPSIQFQGNQGVSVLNIYTCCYGKVKRIFLASSQLVSGFPSCLFAFQLGSGVRDCKFSDITFRHGQLKSR
uniref:RNA polymerase II elongation factor ELL N-terminal domain-containing protein n=1 Tax=Strigamia maritima TaxID=126957 RepID=T1JP56_STRMM